jgi:hypothetical protein
LGAKQPSQSLVEQMSPQTDKHDDRSLRYGLEQV